MSFFYFSHVQEVSCKEYFYYHSAALSNTQICISLARPKNPGKKKSDLCKWLNECSPFPYGDNQCVVFHAGTSRLCLLPGPDGLQTHLHECDGSLSPLVDKFLSTELFFPWAGHAGRRICLQEYESSRGRWLVWAGAPPRASDLVSRGIFGTLLLYETFTPKVLTQAWLSFYSGKAPSRADCCHLCPLSPAVFPQGLCWGRRRFPVGNANHFMLEKRGRQAVR